MPAERITVTVSPELTAAVRSLAADSDRSVSSIVEEALAGQLLHHALGQAVKAYEATDVGDVHVASLVDHGDVVVTSDPHDLCALVTARRVKAAVTLA